MDSEDLKKIASELAIESVNPIKSNKAENGFPKKSSRNNFIDRAFSSGQ